MHQFEDSHRAHAPANDCVAHSNMPPIYPDTACLDDKQIKKHRRIIHSPFLVTELCTLGLAQGGPSASLTWHCLSMANHLYHPQEIISVVSPSFPSADADEAMPFVPYSHLPAPVSATTGSDSNQANILTTKEADLHVAFEPHSSSLEQSIDTSLHSRPILNNENSMDHQMESPPLSKSPKSIELQTEIICESKPEGEVQTETQTEAETEPITTSATQSQSETIAKSQPILDSSPEQFIEKVQTEMFAALRIEPPAELELEAPTITRTQAEECLDSQVENSQLDQYTTEDLKRRLVAAEAEANFAKNEIQRSETIIATLRSQLDAATSACEELLGTVKEQEKTIELLM